MDNPVVAAAKEIVEKAFADTQYELVDLEFKRERSGWNIIIYADKPEGLNLDDCERINNMVDPLLDADERISGRHDHLIVSSPGVDRPIRDDRDFQRNMGKLLDIRLTNVQEGRKNLVGRLLAVDEGTITVELAKVKKGGTMVIERSNLLSVRQYIDFE